MVVPGARNHRRPTIGAGAASHRRFALDISTPTQQYLKFRQNWTKSMQTNRHKNLTIKVYQCNRNASEARGEYCIIVQSIATLQSGELGAQE